MTDEKHSWKCPHCEKWIGSMQVHEDCAREQDERKQREKVPLGAGGQVPAPSVFIRGQRRRPSVTVRGSMKAGRLIGARVARRLRDFIHDEGLDGDVEWDPGWPIGSVRFSVTGPEGDVEACIRAIERWAP